MGFGAHGCDATLGKKNMEMQRDKEVCLWNVALNSTMKEMTKINRSEQVVACGVGMLRQGGAK